MGIFKKTKNTVHRVIDDDPSSTQQQEHILEIDHTEESLSPTAARKNSSPRLKQGFFKSHTKRIKKKRNNFQRLSSSCSTPLNAYEPPGQGVFFPKDDTKKETKDAYEPPGQGVFFPKDDTKKEPSDASHETIVGTEALNKTNANSPSSIANTELEMQALTAKGIPDRKARAAKEHAFLKHIHTAAAKKEAPKKSGTTPKKGFQKLSDEESLFGSPAPKMKNRLYTVPPPSLVKSGEESMDLANSEDQQSVGQDYEPPPNFVESHVPPPVRQFSDVSEGQSSRSHSETIEVVESNTTLTESKSSEEVGISSSSSSSSQQGSNGGKFSDLGSAEFRQFVFDKQFSKIETVSVEKSNSGAGDPLLSAAAALTSKLKGNGAAGKNKGNGTRDKYTTSAARPVLPRKTDDKHSMFSSRTSAVSETSKFPSPKFPPSESVKKPKQTLTKQPETTFTLENKKQHVHKISDDQSGDFRRRRQPPSTRNNPAESFGKPPKAIIASSEFTVVSNMSATYATTETFDRASKSSGYNKTSRIPEEREQPEEDPFTVSSVADDTFWEEADDESPFDVGDKTKLKYQGGQVKKSSSSSTDDSLIASIRKATTRSVSSTSTKKPDPSPRAMRTSLSSNARAGGGGSGKKWILESAEEARERSAKKNRTPIKLQDDVASAKSTGSAPVRELFSSPIESNYANTPLGYDDDDESFEDSVSRASTSATSVYDKAQQFEERRKLFRPSPRKESGSRVGNSFQQSNSQAPPPPPPPPISSHINTKQPLQTLVAPQNNSRQMHNPYGSGIQKRPEALLSALSGRFPHMTKSGAENFPIKFSGAGQRKLVNVSEGNELENQTDDELEEEDDEDQENKGDQPSRRGAYDRHHAWQEGDTSGDKSVQSNPSCVPQSAIAASMLFQNNPTESSRTLALPKKEEVDQEALEMDDQVDEELPDVPPAVHVSDSVDAVSSITEEASYFYQKSFQLWSKTAHNALNNIQKGAFTANRGPGQYRAQNYRVHN